jgi:hypothetical protein
MMRRRFLKNTALIGLVINSSALDEPLEKATAISKKTSPGANAVTKEITLDGQWLLRTDEEDIGHLQKWYMGIPRGAKSARIPGIIQEIFPGYHGVAWYEREFEPPRHPESAGRYLIHFERADYLAEVWLNGTAVGKHEGGETPFTLDVTEAIRAENKNLLVVRILNPSNNRIDGIVLNETPHLCKVIPFRNGAMYDYGGINGSVTLRMVPAVWIEDLYTRPDWKTGKIRIQIRGQNSTNRPVRCGVRLSIAPDRTGVTSLMAYFHQDLLPGIVTIEKEVRVENVHLWDLNDPYLYRVTASIHALDLGSSHEISVRCGFRDFRVEKGYFRLNGKRMFWRSTHTLNHCPVGQNLPPANAPDLLRRDLFYAKASGFNGVRFIAGIARPYQLDLCDEIGLLVYEETMASWELHNSPEMKKRYEDSIRGMILRDRNHPSVVMWGMLNETREGPVFREAVSTLQVVRSLDDTRLVLLGSGRWDGQLSIGSVSNPGSGQWECVWGNEGAGRPSVATARIRDYWLKVGDIHFYPEVPQTQVTDHALRTLGQLDEKPVFLSEYGIGSMMDVIHNSLKYQETRMTTETEDYQLMRSMAARLVADWNRMGMDSVYPFPQDFLRDSQRWEARHRKLGFNLIRSNPHICGFNLTGMLDHVMTGEGVWGFWRDWKPGVMDAMRDGWAPLRWCLFVTPTHTYAGRTIKIEAVLANEDVLAPGRYPVRFRIWGPKGTVWERSAVAQIPEVTSGEDGPLAVPVLTEEIRLHEAPGEYYLVADTEAGFAPAGRRLEFYLSDAANLPHLEQDVTFWGISKNLKSWFKTHGVTGEEFSKPPQYRREIIVVGDLSRVGASGEDWIDLARRMAKGSVTLFLSHSAFKREEESTGWLPLARKGRVYRFYDWLYHKECVAKEHPIFQGLQTKGILNWYYYGPVIPHDLFDGQDTPHEVVAAAFAAGYPVSGGYASGILLGTYYFGKGRFVINTFPLLEYAGNHPAADRLLLNLVQYAASFVGQPLAALPMDFDYTLKSIGYL